MHQLPAYIIGPTVAAVQTHLLLVTTWHDRKDLRGKVNLLCDVTILKLKVLNLVIYVISYVWGAWVGFLLM